jgi:hypothetical protein
MTILDRYVKDENFEIQNMEGIDFRICKKDQFFDAKHLFNQYNEVYYPIDTYKKKKASKGVREWNMVQSRSENMYKGTIANFDKLFNSDEINMDELVHFMKKNDPELITLDNIPHKSKLDYMIRKTGGSGRYQQVFVHPLVAEDMRLYIKRSSMRTCNKTPEREIANRLSNELLGICEVKLDNGRLIDILTDDEVIEVKIYKDRIKAIGQVIYYQSQYPELRKRIHIFGHNNERDSIFTQTCKAYDITVTYEN